MSSRDLEQVSKDWVEQQVVEQGALQQELMERLEQPDVHLRFDRTWLSASCLAEQYYCEKKVELRFLHGDVDTESKQLGSEAHDHLVAKAVQTKREEIFQRIHAGELVIPQEMLVFSRYRNFIIMGRPDAIVFYGTRPLLLFEYKFSKSSFPYKSYHVQARVYGKILERMGFDTSQLHYVIAVAPLAGRHDQDLFQKVFEASINNGLDEATITVGEANIYIYRYRPLEAQRDIDWTLDFWKSTRDAVPTGNPNKCRSCEYLDKCDDTDNAVSEN